MDITGLTSVYDAPGPFATVLLDVGRASETADDELRLRVRHACEQLAEQGADEDVVRTVEERLTEDVDLPAPVGRLLVANAGGVVLDETSRVQVDRPVATYGPVPDVGRWLAHQDGVLTFVLALVDHTGGDVATYRSDIPEPETEASAGGETLHVNKVPVGGWAALRYMHETENVWKQNADDVADEVRRQVDRSIDLILVAGDPYSRSAVAKTLQDDEGPRVLELESGSRAEDGGDEALQQAVREALMDERVRRRVETTHELRERLGQERAVATGVRDTADAFVRGQVDVLLLDPEAAAEHEVDPTAHEGLDLGGGVEGPVRADQGLVAAAARTGAHVSVLPATALGGAPVAALLRWDQPGS